MSILLNKVSRTLTNIGKLTDYQINNYYGKDLLHIDKKKLLGVREIYRDFGISHSTIKKYLGTRNIKKVGLRHIFIIDDDILRKAKTLGECAETIDIKNAKEKKIILSYISFLLSNKLKKG